MVGMKGCSGLPFHVDFVALAMSVEDQFEGDERALLKRIQEL